MNSVGRFFKGESRVGVATLNTPEATGYSVFVTRGEVEKRIGVHTHTPGEDLSFYNTESGAVWEHTWAYMPVERGEVITQIWAVWEKPRVVRLFALVFMTSRNRVRFMGGQPNPYEGGDWLQLWGGGPSLAGPRRIYFNENANAGPLLGFDGNGEERSPPNLPLPRLPRPALWPGDWEVPAYYYTSAALRDVEDVTPCLRPYIQDGVQPAMNPMVVIGLLLRYSSGRRECVGQIRLDSLGAPCRVAWNGTMWLRFVTTFMGPCVAEVKHCQGPWTPPRDDDGCVSKWFPVSWRRRLKWWTTWGTTYVSHE